MRPTGVVLIAIYHFLGAVLLLVIGVGLVVGGTVFGAMFGRVAGMPGGGTGFGLLIGALGAAFCVLYAAVLAGAGYGVWTLREWGRILSIVLAVVALLFALPGLMLGLHMHFFFGSYRLVRIAISILIVWYLMQPQVRSLFQRATPARM